MGLIKYCSILNVPKGHMERRKDLFNVKKERHLGILCRAEVGNLKNVCVRMFKGVCVYGWKCMSHNMNSHACRL